MPFIQTPITFQRIQFEWLRDAVHDVWKRARFLVRGKLLKPNSWKLHHSIYGRVESNGQMGEVGSALPYAKIWELEGMKGPIKAAPGKVIVIKKRGSGSNRSRFGKIVKVATYTRTTYKRPVYFLRTALMDEMTGPKGRQKLQTLGLAVGYAILTRYANLILKEPNLTINASSPSSAISASRINARYGLGLNITAPSTSPLMNRYVRRTGGFIR